MMKAKQFLIGTLFLLSSLTIYCQNEKNIWYFGNHAGLDFNSGAPVALANSSMYTLDNCTSVADESGNLLFYSNGKKIWNKNHMIMPNGDNLMGDTTCTNGSLAVLQPGRNNVYYLFTNDAFAGPEGLRYSVIDMTLDDGNGDVTAEKNISILTPNTEKVLAVYHQNNQDIWIIAHEWNSDGFRAYLLTKDSLSTIPVISHTGSIHSGGTSGTYNSMGQISASPTGSKIALAIYDLQQYELFDFDNSTGIISNPIVIPGYSNAWGVEFSPDGTKLYTTRWMFSGVYQFDVSSNNATTIISSVVQVGEVTTNNPTYKAGFLQLGPDYKVYIAKWGSATIASVSNPNESGLLCGFQDDGVFLDSSSSCLAGLPTYIKKPFYVDVENNSTSIPIINVYPNPAHDEISLEINSLDAGEINVELFNSRGQFIATIYTGNIIQGSHIMYVNLRDHLISEEPAGTYILYINTNNNRILKKVIIQ